MTKKAIGEPGRNAEILRHTADQEAGVQSRVFQYPGQHRAGGGLAVGARHCQHPLVRRSERSLSQPLRAGQCRAGRG